MVADAGHENRHRLTGLLRDNAATITTRWVDSVLEQIRGRVTKAELERDFGELFTALLHVTEDQAHYLAPDRSAEVKALLEDMSRTRARQGYTPSETASSVFALKRVVFELADELPETDTDLFRQLMGFSQLLDALGLITFETYARAREEIIQEQSEQLLELTTPVVKIWEGILAVPLVGTLDSARTQVVMEKLLEALVETGSEHAIIDITGVLAVDTQVAQHLLKTVVAARLMGAECTISGIRPQIAQTIVALGIEFGDITTKASLSDALRHALRREGVEVTRDRSSR